jgi:hypothetical protein
MIAPKKLGLNLFLEDRFVNLGQLILLGLIALLFVITFVLEVGHKLITLALGEG